MLSAVASRALTKSARPTVLVQRRTFIDWMTNYPDRIMELKKIHQAGGRKIYTWQKQPTDYLVNYVAIFLAGTAGVQLMFGYYDLATGKNKKE